MTVRWKSHGDRPRGSLDAVEVPGDFFLHDAGGVLTVRQCHFYREIAEIESGVREPNDIQYVEMRMGAIGPLLFLQLAGHRLFELRF